MLCVCDNKMSLEETTYDRNENPMEEIYYCEECGRLFYKDVSVCEDESYWKTPNRLKIDKKYKMYAKYIKEYHNNDVCIGDILSGEGIEDMFELYIALKGYIEGDIFRVNMNDVWYEYKHDIDGNVKLEKVLE